MVTQHEIETYMGDAVPITADTDGVAAIILGTDRELQRSDIAYARLLVTAHGLYEARINGMQVTNSVLNPGWTSYEWRLRVQDFDVTDAVVAGGGLVRIAVTLGNGWYRGKFGFERQRSDYGPEIALLAALVISFEDGAECIIVTSPEWWATTSCITRNSIYNGETIDARVRGHERPLGTRIASLDTSTLVPHVGPFVKRMGEVHPVRIWTSPAGKTLVDFGQNFVGWLRLSVHGRAGDVITIRHAEVIEGSELGTRPLRWAEATDRFVLSGGDDEFEPTFTFHGFRFAEISGWPGEIEPHDLEGVVVHSDIRRTGWFSCSHEGINRLVDNSAWSQRGNFLDIPSDCPQRDEREGWTGDIAVYAPTACFQFDCADFLHKWLLDLLAETRHSVGAFVPMVVPDIVKLDPPDNVLEWVTGPTAIWGDAAVWVPEALWHAYGDVDALRSHYPAMVLHLESIERELDADGLWHRGFQFGDWLDPTAPPDDPADARADRYVVAQACLYHSACFAAEAASVLGMEEDENHWRGLSARVLSAFRTRYVDGGRIASDCPTVYALAIHFDLLDVTDRTLAGERLVELVHEDGFHVSTGFAGTPYVTWALSETGHHDDACRMLLQDECPSWLYPVRMGATTTWERWDSMLPDGRINPGQMTSFNHYALGAVCDWIYQTIGGVAPARPGYAEVLIRPRPAEGLEWAQCSLDSPQGRIAVSWRVEKGAFSLTVVLPEDVLARIVLPDGTEHHVHGGLHLFGCEVSRRL